MKIFSGKVISKKMDKTATVAVERIVAHRLYKKRYKRTKKYHVHDELGAKVDQEVCFTACRPYSKLKKWKIVEIIEKKAKSNGKNGSVKRKTKEVVVRSSGGKSSPTKKKTVKSTSRKDKNTD